MSSICLGMIVRDAGEHIARCINSARPLIDQALFIDTGSKDNTKQVIEETLNGSVPYKMFESEWQGHYINRTELLAKVREETNADYCLMLDADMELLIERELRKLDKDEYMIQIRDRALIYPLPLLTSTKRPFYYAGVAHCYLACEGDPATGEMLNELALIDHGGGGHRPGKIERDRDLLSIEVGKNPGDRRSWFYLAQSFRDLDQVEEAICAYKVRASLGGWDEEVYQSLYQAGALLCEHVNFYEGVKLLIAAADLKHNRAEALRALAGCAISVANKIPVPDTEVLFVEPGAYGAQPLPNTVQFPVGELPPLPSIRAKVKRRVRTPISAKDVTAIIVTRGDVPLEPIVDTLPYDQLIVWDNALRPYDYKIFGRYTAIPEAKHAVIYWQDDDVIFTAHDKLLKAYQPGVAIANMDQAWIQGAGYGDHTALFGAGSLCDAHLPHEVFSRYLNSYPFDDDLLVEADFAFGTLVNWRRVDLDYGVREFADNLDRLYHQPGQTARKWEMIKRCQEMLKIAA